MKGINDLPILVWPIIFRNLSVEELFNCRLVNKKFKKYSDHSEGIYKLLIGEIEKEDENYWSYDNQLIKEKDIISLKCFKIIQSLLIFNINKNLKYLKIHDAKFDLEKAKNLTNLESLEFGANYENNLKNDVEIINLKNLKVLAIKFSKFDFNFEINSPKLEKLEIWNTGLIKFNCNPESIKHLILSNCQNEDELKIFKNLEILEFRQNSIPMNENVFTIFENLKQLKINSIYNSNKSNEMRIYLSEILNIRTKLKREIDIYFEGVNLINIDKLNEFFNEDSLFKFNFNNYELLDSKLLYFTFLLYDQLDQCLCNIKNDLPSSFFDKYLNLTSIKIYRTNDLNGLNWFLNNLKCLRSLEINSRKSFGQDFFNNLPDTIRHLTIYQEEVNYDFILKLTKLVEFYTQSDRDLFDLALKVFSNLKYFKFFTFDFRDKTIEIEKFENNYYLRSNDLKEGKMNHEKLIEICSKIKSDLNNKKEE